MNIFTAIIENGQQSSHLCNTWEKYNELTFSPKTEVVCCLPLMVSGKTYWERKNSLRDLAIDVQCNDQGGLSWSECKALGDFLERNARRFGLVQEFRENNII